MMRSRTIREGSVGLLALLGVFLFGAFIIWLRGVNFTRKGYEIVAEFPDVYGIQIGASVRYRGVEVGRVSKIEASSNRVGVVMEIASTELIMPHQIAISTNRSGLIGESFIDIIPQTNLSANAESMSPVSSDCNSDLIVCQGDRLQGETSVTFEQLLPSLLELSNTYGDPKFIEKLSNTLQNTSQAALEASRLSKELTILSSSIRGEIKTFSGSANTLFASANRTSNQVKDLSGNINNLIVENRGYLNKTLSSINQTTDQLRNIVARLEPTLDKVNSSLETANFDKLLENVEIVTDNAANVSANLRDLSKSLNDPNNLLVVQQTLNSARATFENAQKITADLDELTGDPSFRTNLRKLVDGLSKLVSYTDTLEQQITTASNSSVESNKSFSHFSSLNADRIVSTPFDFGDRLCFSPCTPKQEAE